MLFLNPQIVVTVVFCLVYLYLIFFKHHRGIAVWCGIVLLSIFSLFLSESLFRLRDIPGFVNWNVIGIFAGTLVLAEIFIHSKVPVLLSDILVDRSKNVGMAILWVCALSSFISAFVEDVTTTGGSVKEVIDAVRKSGGEVIAVAAVVDRSGGKAEFDVPYFSLFQMAVQNFSPDACPMCESGSVAVKPGSRGLN